MKKGTLAVLPALLLAPAAALFSGGCGSTSPSSPTPTLTAQPGTAIIAGKLVAAGTPSSGKTVRLWNYNTGQEFSGSPATTDSNGNYSFSGVPVNSAGADQWFVKWTTAGTTYFGPAGTPTPDFTQFGLVQSRAFSVNQSTTYTVPDMDTAAQGLALTLPAENYVGTLSGAPTFTWTTTSMTNNGYGWRIDSAPDFQSNLCSVPSTGWTPGMTTTTPNGSNCSSLSSSSSTRYWRVGIEESTAGGITVVATTKYYRVTLN